ncbi:MAG: hypothetical protein WAU60_04480 [Candidatus Competibacter denitrificans]|jgi:hypothetical protein
MSAISETPEMILKAQQAINTEEVQQILRRLADFGLGIFMPHLHPEEGGFAPLPSDVVAVERNLKVLFVKENDIKDGECVPVGWRWDNERQAVAFCQQCANFYHH